MAPPWPQFSPAAWPLNFFQLYKKTKMLLDKREWNSAKVMVNNLATWGQCKQTILKNWTVGKFIHQTWSLLSDPVLFFKNTFLLLSIDTCKMHKRRQKVRKLNTETYMYVYGTGRSHKYFLWFFHLSFNRTFSLVFYFFSIFFRTQASDFVTKSVYIIFPPCFGYHYFQIFYLINLFKNHS